MEVQIKHDLEYAKEGLTHKAKFIECREFSAYHLKNTAPIKQICMRAFASFGEKDHGLKPDEVKKVAKEDLKPEDIMSALYLSNEDISQFFLYMKELLTDENICLIDGEERLTRPLFDKLHNEDLEQLCGKYLLDFILASALKD